MPHGSVMSRSSIYHSRGNVVVKTWAIMVSLSCRGALVDF